MGKTKSLSYAEHLELAARVKEARNLLQDIQIRVGNGFGTSSKLSALANQTVKKFSDLRNELDNAVFRDHPEIDGEELKGLYYGSTKNSKVVLHRSRTSE